MPIGSLELVAIGVVLWTNAHQCTHVSGTHTHTHAYPAYTYANQDIHTFSKGKGKGKGSRIGQGTRASGFLWKL